MTYFFYHIITVSQLLSANKNLSRFFKETKINVQNHQFMKINNLNVKIDEKN